MSIEKERMSGGFMPRWVRNEHLARFEFVCDFVKNKIVIDCACGVGIGSTMFARAQAKQVWAYDLSADDIFEAQEKNHLPNLVFAVADATKLPCAGQVADIFVSLETIEHLSDDNVFLTEMKRVLKNGGTFICSSPNRIVTNPLARLSDKPWNKFHAREYSRIEFENMMRKYFSSVEVYGQNPREKWRVRLSNTVAKLLSTYWAVRFNQLLKLPGLIFDLRLFHQVELARPGVEYEYLIAVCK